MLFYVILLAEYGPGYSAAEFIYKDFEEKIKNNLGPKVTIKPKDNNKGKIEIEYYTQNEFERIALLLANSQG